MNKYIGIVLVLALGGALLAYSASRSLDLIMMTLPADRQVLAYFGLAALDGGLVAWILAYLYGSTGAIQRAIAMLMIIVDFCGATMMFSLDTLYNSGQAGLVQRLSQDTIYTAIIGLSAVIALNIAATVAHHLTDPDQMRRQAEEEARAMIDDLAIQQIRRNAAQLASQVAPRIAADWQSQTEAEYTNKLRRKLPAQLPAMPAQAYQQTTDVPAQLPAQDEPDLNPTKPPRRKS
jgi:hypothetical protein